MNEIKSNKQIYMRERVINVSSCSTIEAVGAVIGQPRLSTHLADDGLILATGLPHQHYIDTGYFAVVEDAPGRLQVLVTQRGKIELARRYLPARTRAGATLQ